jgi:hypothetical protein
VPAPNDRAIAAQAAADCANQIVARLSHLGARRARSWAPESTWSRGARRPEAAAPSRCVGCRAWITGDASRAASSHARWGVRERADSFLRQTVRCSSGSPPTCRWAQTTWLLDVAGGARATWGATWRPGRGSRSSSILTREMLAGRRRQRLPATRVLRGGRRHGAPLRRRASSTWSSAASRSTNIDEPPRARRRDGARAPGPGRHGGGDRTWSAGPARPERATNELERLRDTQPHRALEEDELLATWTPPARTRRSSPHGASRCPPSRGSSAPPPRTAPREEILAALEAEVAGGEATGLHAAADPLRIHQDWCHRLGHAPLSPAPTA